MISRRSILAAPAVLLFRSRAFAQSAGGGLVQAPRNRPKLGAIRWDPWYSMDSASPGYELAVSPGTLAPNSWQFRAPLHAANYTGANTISWAGASQATFDAEIQAANLFGLDYWIFLRYEASNPTMNYALSYYLTSQMLNRPRFALMKQTDGMGNTGNFSVQNADTLNLMRNKNYMFVKGNRPIFYVLYVAASIANNWGGNIANLKACIDGLRASVQATGLGNPYVVCLGGGTSPATGMGADCYSHYGAAFAPLSLNTPFATMDSNARAKWIADLVVFSPYIPPCNVGYDPTPLNEKPPSWWTNNPVSVLEPTNAELIAHLQAGVDFVRANRNSCDADTVLIYAWSECAEGGVAMMPTVGNPTGTKGLALLGVR